MADYSKAIEMYVDNSRVFLDANPHNDIVIHKTAGFSSAKQVAVFFATVKDERSAHYIVGQNGEIIQCVREKDGAGANCCLSNNTSMWSYNTYWNRFNNTNLNLYTISIEHVDPDINNQTPLTEAQKEASFELVLDICKRKQITASHIWPHNSISNTVCPGNYPLQELKDYIKKNMQENVQNIPDGWTDNGMVLTAPNNVEIRDGFRTWILSHNWDSNDIPLYPEKWCMTLEESNISIGSGSELLCHYTRLCWRKDLNQVYKSYVGDELNFWRNKK